MSIEISESVNSIIIKFPKEETGKILEYLREEYNYTPTKTGWNIDNDRLPIWVVYTMDSTGIKVRAIDLDNTTARRHKKAIEEDAIFFDKKEVKVYITKTEADHLYFDI